MVFYDVDPKNKNKVIEQEEEMQVDEAWVRDEFSCSAHYQYAP
jgi:hypothetical protein